MMHAYDELYLEEAQRSLGLAFDYAWYVLNLQGHSFAEMFTKTKYAALFETGNPYVISGQSGFELCFAIVDEYTHSSVTFNPEAYKHKGLTPVYWAGWILAWYQWYSARRFKEIFAKVTFDEIVVMYPAYHEMDRMRFFERIEEIFHDKKKPTNLCVMRKSLNLSQSQLSKKSGVGIKTIQMYEQRINNIDNGQTRIIYKLARALDCDICDLLENPLEE